MWSRSELKTNAKAALKKYFGKALVAIIIVAAISACVSWVIGIIVNLTTGVSSSQLDTLKNINLNDGSLEAYASTEMPEGYAAASSLSGLLNFVAQVFVVFPLSVGLYRFFEMSRGFQTGFGELFAPFKKFAHVGLVMFVMGLKVCLWSLLLVVPGIIKAYEYSMVPYLLAENPELSGKRAFQISKAMTKGNKWNLFVLDLSFILWHLLGVCTCGLAYIWVAPYINATGVEAYYKLKAGAVANGALALQEVPDICLPAQQPMPPFGQAAATTDVTAAAPAVTTAATSDTNSSVVTTAAAAAVATAATAAAANAVSNAAETAQAPAAEAVTEAAAPAASVAEAVAESAPVEAVKEAAEAVAESAPVEAVKEAAEAVAESAPVEAVKEAAEKVAESTPVEAVKEAAEKVADAVEAPAEAVKEAVDNAVETVSEKISDATGVAEETVKDVVENVVEKVSEKAETPSAE